MILRRLLLGVALTALAASPAWAADHLVLQQGWLPGGDRAQAYVAQQEGIFAAHGLDVEIRAGKGSADMFAKLAAGAADVGEGSFDALLGSKVAAPGLPVTAIMPIFTAPPDALITTQGSGITSIKDVAGKTVATATFTSSNLPWPLVLRLNGVDPASVTLLKTDPATLAALLAHGRADAIIQWTNAVPAIRPVLAEVGKQPVALAWANYGFAGYSNALFASNQALASKRDAVHRFVLAMRQAELVMRDNPARAAADVKALAPEADLATIRGQLDATVPLIFTPTAAKDGLGVWSPAVVATTWDWVSRELQVPPDRLDPQKSVDLSIGEPAGK